MSASNSQQELSCRELLSALTEIVNDTKWQCIGNADELSKRKCTKFYTIPDGDDAIQQPDDVAVFYVSSGQFYAIDSSCPHEGGPLDLGDIEDITGAGDLAVICPWHYYDFNLKTGESETGLRTNTYEVRVVDGRVYVNIEIQLSLSKPSESTESSTRLCVSAGGNKIAAADETITGWARNILNTPQPDEKVRLTKDYVERWRSGKPVDFGEVEMPTQPQRKENLTILEPGKIKRGRGGTLNSRIAILHSLANIEQWAIDLAWDIVGRFVSHQVNGKALPTEFFSDFIKVADDEAKHFTLIEKRLVELGSHFGALPVHNGLWQSAMETAHDILARLAIVHMVHEARGLDVHPKTSQRFASQGDKESVGLMEVIYTDEITHVTAGMKWFLYVCQHSDPPLEPVSTFHGLVRKHFKGYLKPPFNTSGRQSAGMAEEWYMPLIQSVA